MPLHWTLGEAFQLGAAVRRDYSNRRICHCPTSHRVSNQMRRKPACINQRYLLPIPWIRVGSWTCLEN